MMHRTQSLPSDVTSELTGLEWLNTVTLSLATLEVDDASPPGPLVRNRPMGGSLNKKNSNSSGNAAVQSYRRRSVSVSGSISDMKRNGGRSRSKSTTTSGVSESGYTSACSDPDSPGSSETDQIDEVFRKSSAERATTWKSIRQLGAQPPYALDGIIALAMCMMKPKHHSVEKVADCLRSQVPFFAATTQQQLEESITSVLQSNKHFVQSRSNRLQWTCIPTRLTSLVCPKADAKPSVTSSGGGRSRGSGMSRSLSVPTSQLSSSLPSSALPWAAMTVRGADVVALGGGAGTPLRRRLSGKKKSDSGGAVTTSAPITAPKRRRSLGSASKSTTYKAKPPPASGTTGGVSGAGPAGRFRSQSLSSHPVPSVADVLNDAPDLTGMAAWQHLDAHARAHALVDPGETLLRGGFDPHDHSHDHTHGHRHGRSHAVPVAGHVFPNAPPPLLLHQHQFHQYQQQQAEGGSHQSHHGQTHAPYGHLQHTHAPFVRPSAACPAPVIDDDVFEGFGPLDTDAFMFDHGTHHPNDSFGTSGTGGADGVRNSDCQDADDLWAAAAVAAATETSFVGFETASSAFTSDLDMHLGEESIPDVLLSGRTSSDNDESWLPTTYIGGSGSNDDLLTVF